MELVYSIRNANWLTKLQMRKDCMRTVVFDTRNATLTGHSRIKVLRNVKLKLLSLVEWNSISTRSENVKRKTVNI